MENKLQVTADNAKRFADWLATRGGLAVWRSEYIGDTDSVTTPYLDCFGVVTQKPHWKYGLAQHITKAEDVEVCIDVAVESFVVRFKQSQGRLVLNKSSYKKVKEAVERAGTGAYYEFGVKDPMSRTVNALLNGEDVCTIYRCAQIVPLPLWLETHE